MNADDLIVYSNLDIQTLDVESIRKTFDRTAGWFCVPRWPEKQHFSVRSELLAPIVPSVHTVSQCPCTLHRSQNMYRRVRPPASTPT